MRFHEITEALKPSEYRPLVKSWDRSKYEELFKSSPLQKDKNAYRLYIPLASKSSRTIKVPTYVENEVSAKGYQVSDYKAGVAKNKAGRSIKIGKLLSKEARDKFNTDKNRTAVKNTYMVVISRHPYDVGGMSTDRGWRSCMNLRGGSYKEYVPIDVKAGTIIAYVTTIDDPDLKHPVGRLLIKPFVNKDYSNMAVLGIENEVYGSNVTGFVDVVEKWVDEVNSKHKIDGIVTFEQNIDLYYGGADPILLGNPELLAALDLPSTTDFSKFSNDELILLVTQNGYAIQYIKNPSEAVQLAAVSNKENGAVISHIKHPSEAVQLAAVSKNGYAIEYIHNPSEAVKLAAVGRNRFVIQYIKNPSEAVQLAAVNQNGDAIELINNPSYVVQLAAVSKNGYAIEHIKNPSEAVQLAAVKDDGYVIKYIKNSSEAVQLAAVKEYRYAIKYIKNPSEAVQLAAQNHKTSR